MPAGTYYLVVDGENGMAGAFELEVLCGHFQYLNEWRDCPENPDPPTTYDTTQATSWHFDSGLYCGTGCDFEMYVALDCGSEFHIPLYDVESGHIMIFSFEEDRYVELTAWSTGGFFQQGARIDWSDRNCPSEWWAGSDPLFNEQTMDISFQGNPTVCGVYRLEFHNWGGYVWDLFANCSGESRPGFRIYDNFCDAVENLNPLPELSVFNVVVDEADCPDITIDFDVTNVGCYGAEGPVQLYIENDPGTMADDFLLDQANVGALGPGEVKHVSIDLTLAQIPETVAIMVDYWDTVLECSEAPGGSAVACNPQGGSHRFEFGLCGNCEPPVFEVAAATDEFCERGIVLSWEPATFDSGTGGYNIYKSEISFWDAITNRRLLVPPGADFRGLSYTDASAVPGTTYYYVIEAEDAAPGSSCQQVGYNGGSAARLEVSATETLDDLPPDDVGNTLRAIDKTFMSVTFAWQDNRPPGDRTPEDHYHIKRTEDPTSAFNFFDIQDPHDHMSLSFTDPLAPEKLYFYDVRIADGCENESVDPFPPTGP
jgi:hypothetical protein